LIKMENMVMTLKVELPQSMLDIFFHA